MLYEICFHEPQEYSKELLEGEDRAIVDAFDYVADYMIDEFAELALHVEDMDTLDKIRQEIAQETLDLFKEYLKQETRHIEAAMVDGTYIEHLQALYKEEK